MESPFVLIDSPDGCESVDAYNRRRRLNCSKNSPASSWHWSQGRRARQRFFEQPSREALRYEVETVEEKTADRFRMGANMETFCTEWERESYPQAQAKLGQAFQQQII